MCAGVSRPRCATRWPWRNGPGRSHEPGMCRGDGAPGRSETEGAPAWHRSVRVRLRRRFGLAARLRPDAGKSGTGLAGTPASSGSSIADSSVARRSPSFSSTAAGAARPASPPRPPRLPTRGYGSGVLGMASLHSPCREVTDRQRRKSGNTSQNLPPGRKFQKRTVFGPARVISRRPDGATQGQKEKM